MLVGSQIQPSVVWWEVKSMKVGYQASEGPLVVNKKVEKLVEELVEE